MGAGDFFQDGGSLCTPDIALRLAVALDQPALDGAHQLRHALETALTNYLLGEIAEKTFDQVEPRAARGCEVLADSWMAGQPGLDRRMFVGCVVVHDQVQGEFRRRFSFDLPQKPQPFHMGVARFGAGNDPAIRAAKSVVVPWRT